MSNQWFTSDLHYFHKNIAGPKVSSWKSGYRNFENEVEMSQHIVSKINKSVKYEDTLWVLGDWSFSGIQNVWNLRKQLTVKNLHLILGNHDEHITKNKLLPNVVSINGSYISKDNPTIVGDPVFSRDIFTTVQNTAFESVNNVDIFMSHYKHNIWPSSHKGVIHLYGHSHSTAEHNVIGKSMDVGIDNAYKILKEYRPFHLDEILNLMKNRNISFNDHHDKNTNA
jgi:calcineurin-like phosphoesterase family protein